MHSRKFLLLLIAALLLLLAACDDTTSPLEPDPPITLAADAAPYIIDTDMTTDDWIAITILLNHPHADVRAITVSGTGVARCDAGVQNALDLAALAGRPDIPVTCGRETPMEGDHAFPDAWRDASATLAGVSVPDNPNPPADMTAVELLIQTIHEADQPVTLVTLGPLTNVAEAFEADPTIIQNISMIWTMGGAMDVPGDITTDIIVGFPGETDEDFEMTMSILRDVQYDGIFAFKYSQRPNTAALKLDGHLPEDVKERRLARVLALQQEITVRKNRESIGSVQEVLVDGNSKKGGKLSGRTRGNRVVNFDGPGELIGTVVRVRVTSSGVNSLAGELCE